MFWVLPMANLLLPYSARSPRTLAAEAAIDRLLNLDFDVLDVYNIDTVPESALYHLADQFNVLGYRGWLLADTLEQKRDLVKRSIELHKTAGTPYAIKRVLETVGYPDATITENPGLRYDGTVNYDGSATYEGALYGQFTVTLDPVRSAVSVELIDLIVALINEWKNVRSHLLDLRIGDISLFKNLLLYNGLIDYSGVNSQTYDGELKI